MKLYFSETLMPRKACAVACYLNSPVTFVPVDLMKRENQTSDFLALNPNGKVPVLEDDGMILWEANAIMCYLADAAGSDLWPKDRRQIEVVRWLSWDAQHFTRYAGTLYFENIIKPKFGIGAPDAALIKEADGYFRTAARVLDKHLSDSRFLVGNAPSVADFAVAVALPYAEQAELPLESFPSIRRWHGELNELAGWRNPFPVAA
jgi:glutathione S-transferase